MNKTEVIRFRVDAAEADRIRECARQEGLRVSSWLRRLARVREVELLQERAAAARRQLAEEIEVAGA